MPKPTGRSLPCLLSLLIAVVTCGSNAFAGSILKSTESGDPGVRSIQVLSFAPGGVLLIGDGASGRIVAVETGDTKQVAPLKKPIAQFKKQLAGRLGAPTAKGVEIIDMVVNPASGRIYVAARRQADKQYVIVTVDGDGEIRPFPLDNVRHAEIALSAGDVKVSRVTDIAWAEDRIIAAGRSNETFASKIFSIPTPIAHNAESNSYSAETYHVSHRRWETKAPMSVVIPFRENGQTFVVGAFSCTPVVKYPIDSLKPGAQVKGSSVMELGSGNRPIDMFIYEKDGKPYVLSNTFRFHHERRPFGPSPYWTVKFQQSVLSENKAVNETALKRLKGYEPATDRVEMVESWHGVMQMDKLGDKQAAVLRQTDSGIDLEVLPLP